MRTRLSYIWHSANSSFWFIPVLLILVGLTLAVVCLVIDAYIGDWIVEHVGYVQLHPSGARQVLSTIAGAMMTTASLVFSLTLVVLSLAAQSLGPRIVDQFMQDRLNQTMLGAFIGTFCYALLVSLAVEEGSEQTRVPLLSILVGGVTTIASLVLLIVYIHHISRSIQSDTMIARLNARLDERMESYFPVDPYPATTPSPVVEPIGTPSPLNAEASGYVQIIDIDGLIEIAAENGALVQMHVRQGMYAIKGLPVMTVWGAEPCSKEVGEALMDTVIFGPKRADVQDIELALRNITEIGVRALSPGINDYYTAIAAIDHLSDAAASLMRRSLPNPVLFDAEGRPRLIRPVPSFGDLLDVAFGDLLLAARDNPAVLVVMFERFATLTRCAQNPSHLNALTAFADAFAATVDAGGPPEESLGRLEARIADLRVAIRAAPA